MTGTRGRDPAVVLFDWNGTLVDDVHRARQASSAVRRRWAGTPDDLTDDEFRLAWCLPLSEHVRRLGVPAAHANAAVAVWGVHISTNDAPLSPGTLPTLQSLRRRGVRTAVVTAAGDRALRRDLRAHDIAGFFDRLHSGVIDKAAVIAGYVEQTGERPVWYVGDSRFDMIQARRAAAVAVGYTGGYDTRGELRDAGAHHLIDGLGELPALIVPGCDDRDP